MNDQQLQHLESILVSQGIQETLDAVAKIVKARELQAKSEHDSTLGNAFDYLVALIAEVYPFLPKKKQAFVRAIGTGIPIMESFELRNYEMQSAAFKKAYALFHEFDKME